MKGNVPNSWDWLVRVEEKDLLLEEPVINGQVNVTGEKPVAIC